MDLEDFTIETDADGNDWVLRPAKGFSAGLCTSCGMILPMAKFRRTLSKKWAKSRGYNGDYRYETHSKLCGTCQPRRRWITELKPREIDALMDSYDIDRVTGQHIMEVRRAEADKKRSAKMRERWHKTFRQQWDAIVKDQLTPLSKTVNVQAFRARRKFAAAEPEAKPRYKALVDFFNTYQRIIASARGTIGFRGQTADKPPTEYDWRCYVKDEDKKLAREMWAEIEDKVKMYFLTPDLISSRPDRTKPAPEYKDGHIGTNADAKERLAQIG
jgi:hypothetical protein